MKPSLRLIILAAALLLAACERAAPGTPQATASARRLETPATPASDDLATSMLETLPGGTIWHSTVATDSAGEFQFRQVVSPTLQTELSVFSPGNTRRAFTACDVARCQDHLFFQGSPDGLTYEIAWSSRLPWRPITDLVWLTDDTLVFSQWSQPHYGYRYAINVRTRELTLVLALADDCFGAGRCG